MDQKIYYSYQAKDGMTVFENISTPEMLSSEFIVEAIKLKRGYELKNLKIYKDYNEFQQAQNFVSTILR